MKKPKTFMLYDKEKEYGLVRGREDLRRAKKNLRNQGKRPSSYEYDY